MREQTYRVTVECQTCGWISELKIFSVTAKNESEASFKALRECKKLCFIPLNIKRVRKVDSIE